MSASPKTMKRRAGEKHKERGLGQHLQSRFTKNPETANEITRGDNEGYDSKPEDDVAHNAQSGLLTQGFPTVG